MEEDAGPQVEGDGESVAADVPGFGERGLRGEGCGVRAGGCAVRTDRMVGACPTLDDEDR